MKFGTHLNISNNYIDNYKHAVNHDINCQLYVNKELDINDLVQSRNFLLENPKLFTNFHGDLRYNLAGSVKGTYDPQYNRKINWCKKGILHELDIGSFLNKGVVLHIGSSKEKYVGIPQIINTINDVLILENNITVNLARTLHQSIQDFRNNRQIILENSAGTGNQIGKTLDEISFILSQINPNLRDNVKVCIDTCHIYDAGQYNFGNPESINQFYDDFNDKIGLNKLELYHLNDSKNLFGSKKDRHEHLTKGYIYGKYVDKDNQVIDGLPGLHELISRANFGEIPIIGEFNDGDYISDKKIIHQINSRLSILEIDG